MERNGWLKLLVGLIITLILGGYGYTYTSVSNLEDKVLHRLDRLDQGMDRIEDYLIEALRRN